MADESDPGNRLRFERSSFCDAGGCVEVARESGRVHVRHSRTPDAVLSFSADEWAAFLAGADQGEFNPLP